MCTIGALRLASQSYLLFKNKDFGRRSFEDAVVLDRSVFGVRGTVDWAKATGETLFSGFSLGANQHGLMACDADVLTTAGQNERSYDDLVEIALCNARDVSGAIAAIRQAVEEQAYMRGNIVLVDDRRMAAVEVRGTTIAVEDGDLWVCRTNHHLQLGDKSGLEDGTGTSASRLAQMQAGLQSAAGVAGVMGLLRAHGNGASGVCNHRKLHTVYSYILCRQDNSTKLLVGKGHPCEVDSYVELQVPFGPEPQDRELEAFRNCYPSSRSHR